MSKLSKAREALNSLQDVWLAYPHDCRLTGVYSAEMEALEELVASLEALAAEEEMENGW